MFIPGIELYLSEPVNCDDQFLVSLFRLWQLLANMEKVRIVPTSREAKMANEILWPSIVRLAQQALPLATEIHQKVDTAIEKMKPLGSLRKKRRNKVLLPWLSS